MAGWGEGQWGPMLWGGQLNQYIKVAYIKVKNYFESIIRIK